MKVAAFRTKFTVLKQLFYINLNISMYEELS